MASLDVMRDKNGLKQAKVAKAALDTIVKAFEKDKSPPDESSPAEAPQQVKNPFA